MYPDNVISCRLRLVGGSVHLSDLLFELFRLDHFLKRLTGDVKKISRCGMEEGLVRDVQGVGAKNDRLNDNSFLVGNIVMWSVFPANMLII